MALRFDEYGPAGTEATEGVVQPASDGDELGWHCAVEVRTAKAGRTLQTAVFVEDDAFAGERRPG